MPQNELKAAPHRVVAPRRRWLPPQHVLVPQHDELQEVARHEVQAAPLQVVPQDELQQVVAQHVAPHHEQLQAANGLLLPHPKNFPSSPRTNVRVAQAIAWRKQTSKRSSK